MAGGEFFGEGAEVGEGLFGVAFGGLVGVDQTPAFEERVRVEVPTADGRDGRAKRREGDREPVRGILAPERVDHGGRRVRREA